MSAKSPPTALGPAVLVEPSSGKGGPRASGGDAPATVSDTELECPEVLKVSRIRVPRLPRPWLPDLDEQQIADCLHLEDCETRVAAHHRHLFVALLAGEVAQATQNRDLVQRHIRGLEGRMAALAARILRLDELVKNEQAGEGAAETTAWSSADLGAAVVLGVFSLVLLGMGMNTLATYLLDSGFIIFVQRPALAYLLSAVNVGLAVILKVGSSWCRDDVTRHRYFAWLWGLALASGALWLLTFALIFPNIGSQGVEEVIASLGEKRALSESFLEAVFVCSQLVCEICISAALWMHLERLLRAHTPPVVVVSNPEHRGYVRLLAASSEDLRAAVEKRASLEGWLKALEAGESAYVSKASSAAQAGLDRRQAGRYGLDGNAPSAGLRSVKHEERR